MSFFPYYIGAPRIISLHTILGPPYHFFAYYMGPLRSVSSHTIWGPLSDHFHCLLYGAHPQISFFACYKGATPDFSFSQNIWRPPQISFSAYYMGPPQVSFFAYYMGHPQISFCAYFLGAALRSVFSLTIWGPQISFFA